LDSDLIADNRDIMQILEITPRAFTPTAQMWDD